MQRIVGTAVLVALAFDVVNATIIQRDALDATANPIRKVVNMLQSMQKKVTAEGEKEKELYEKFECYCRNAGGDLQASISAADTKVPALGSDIKAAEEQKVQLEEDLKKHQADRSDAKEAIADATAVREKEAAAYAAEAAEYKSNIGALTKAISAISSGMAGGFLQTSTAQLLRKLSVMSKIDMLDADRQELVAFLSGSQDNGYVPQSGEIVGILKEIESDMTKALEEITATEDSAVAEFEALIAAKKKQIETLTKSIETKSVRIGELAVEIVQMKNDLSDTEKSLLEDQAFLKDLDGNCATKKAEFEENMKTRAEELVALAETIKILNDDDALELFKKTLPSASASASFVQMKADTATLRARVLAILRKVNAPKFDFIMLALQGKKIGFEKVFKMIDEMIATLKEEQHEDDHKQEYCRMQLDQADDKKKDLEGSVEDAETAIADSEQSLATLKDEIKALEKEIKALDKSVAEATENRKEEHEEFTELMASDSAAKELLNFAKNRLNKFYNPKLYQPPPKKVLSEEDQIYSNFGGEASFAQISLHSQHGKDAPPPPPETAGAYAKKSEESTGVISMIGLLIKDLDKEMTEAETTEENDQKEYEQTMNDSAEMRATKSKELTEKQSAKASTEEDLQKHTDDKGSFAKELSATVKYIGSLHSECDWLLKYYDVRKEARAGEVDALNKAKAVLSGADFSLMQTN